MIGSRKKNEVTKAKKLSIFIVTKIPARIENKEKWLDHF